MNKFAPHQKRFMPPCVPKLALFCFASCYFRTYGLTISLRIVDGRICDRSNWIKSSLLPFLLGQKHSYKMIIHCPIKINKSGGFGWKTPLNVRQRKKNKETPPSSVREFLYQDTSVSIRHGCVRNGHIGN